MRSTAAIAQLGERQTEDLKVPGSIPGLGIAHVQTPSCPPPSPPFFLFFTLALALLPAPLSAPPPSPPLPAYLWSLGLCWPPAATWQVEAGGARE